MERDGIAVELDKDMVMTNLELTMTKLAKEHQVDASEPTVNDSSCLAQPESLGPAANENTCANCGKQPDKPGEKYKQCGRCVKIGYIAASFCSQECQEAAWPQHRRWHKQQKVHLDKRASLGLGRIGEERLSASIDAAKKSQDEYDEQLVRGFAHLEKCEHKRAAKAFKQAIKANPARPEAYGMLSGIHTNLRNSEAALPLQLMALERWDEERDGQPWSRSLANAYDLLSGLPNAPRPAWWNDVDLLELSEKALLAGPTSPQVQAMSAAVLAGFSDGTWRAGWRTVDDFRRAAMCFCHASKLSKQDVQKEAYKDRLRECHSAACRLEAAGHNARGRWPGKHPAYFPNGKMPGRWQLHIMTDWTESCVHGFKYCTQCTYVAPLGTLDLDPTTNGSPTMAFKAQS